MAAVGALALGFSLAGLGLFAWPHVRRVVADRYALFESAMADADDRLYDYPLNEFEH